MAEAVTRRFCERFHYKLPVDAQRGGSLMPVDLHWHIAPAVRLRVPAALLWEQGVRTNGGIDVTRSRTSPHAPDHR